MKCLKFIILTFLVCMFCGCSSSNIKTSLQEIADIVEEYPDSAMVMLKHIDKHNITNQSELAHYTLLLERAKYKTYDDNIDVKSLNTGLKYFIKCKDNKKASLTLFLLGKSYEFNGNLGQAATAYASGADYAASGASPYYEGICYKALYGIYRTVYSFKQEIIYAKKACDAFKRSGKYDWVLSAKVDLASAYNNNKEYDKSMKIAQAVIADAASDSTQLSCAYKLMAIGNFVKNNPEKALEYYVQTMHYNPTTLVDTDWQNMSVAIAYSKNISISDEDLACVNEVLQNSENIDFDVYALHNNYKEAYDRLKEYVNEQDSAIWQLSSQNIDSSLIEYNAHKQELENEKKQSERIIWLLVCASFVLIMLCIVIYYRAKLKAKKIEHSNLISEAKELSELVITKQNINSELSLIIKELFGQRFIHINELCNVYYESKDRKIVKAVEKKIKEIADDTKTLDAIENYVNRYADNLMLKFRTDLPALKNEDYKLYLYSVVGFSTSAISLFLSEKKEVVYNRKSRLKAKIKAAMCENSAYYIAQMN